VSSSDDEDDFLVTARPKKQSALPMKASSSKPVSSGRPTSHRTSRPELHSQENGNGDDDDDDEDDDDDDGDDDRRVEVKKKKSKSAPAEMSSKRRPPPMESVLPVPKVVRRGGPSPVCLPRASPRECAAPWYFEGWLMAAGPVFVIVPVSLNWLCFRSAV
jgi:hypothetical protein